MDLNPIAQELNRTIQDGSPTLYALLSDFGKRIYMPKGIVSQGAEAKAKAHRYNATIGIAKENQGPMFLESARKYFSSLEPSQIFEYAPPTGIPDLRAIWKRKILAENPGLAGPGAISNPVVTHALTHGLMVTSDLFFNPGDEILVPDKLWGNYRLMFEVRYGAKIRNYPLFDEGLSGFNVAALEQALAETTSDKVALLFNFPNNPTGYTPTAAEADAIVAAVLAAAEAGKKVLVISDDAYYGLQYADDLIAGSIFSRFAGLHPNVVAVKACGFTKEFYVWGFRVGFLTFADHAANADVYAALEAKCAGAIRCAISNCSRPAQSILLDLMQGDDYHAERAEKYEILRARAAKVREVVERPEYADCWDIYPFNSGYFMCVRLKGVESEALRQHALGQYGVGTISLGQSDLRIAFSCIELEQIEDLFAIVAKSVRELRA
jgi:aspartate/methionine/tyrosine aminotransferase